MRDFLGIATDLSAQSLPIGGEQNWQTSYLREAGGALLNY